jgi:hypothetical protein
MHPLTVTLCWVKTRPPTNPITASPSDDAGAQSVTASTKPEVGVLSTTISKHILVLAGTGGDVVAVIVDCPPGGITEGLAESDIGGGTPSGFISTKSLFSTSPGSHIFGIVFESIQHLTCMVVNVTTFPPVKTLKNSPFISVAPHTAASGGDIIVMKVRNDSGLL